MISKLFGSAVAVLLVGVILQQVYGTVSHSGTQRFLNASAPPQATSVVQSGHVRITINTTQSDYENALALWQAQGVQEYQTTLIDSSQMVIGGEMRLRIRLANGEPRIVEYARPGQEQPQVIPLNTLAPDELEYLRNLTVEARFDLIGEIFNEKSTSHSGPTFDYDKVYDVAFHRTLGYPTHVYSRVSSSGGGLSPTECCLAYEVLSLDIIERLTPGMPKTGNPRP